MSQPSASTPGIRARHSSKCRTAKIDGARCNCTPAYEAFVFDKRSGQKIRRGFTGKGALAAAKAWRTDSLAQMGRGALRAPTRESLREAAYAWLEKAEAGEILSRYRRPYAPSALRGYRAGLERFVLPDFGDRRLSDLSADDFQALVDKLVGKGLSGQTVRNVIVPCQAIYRRHRRQVPYNPTKDLVLPDSSGRRERAATPREAAELLAPLGDDDAALYATAFYAGLRRGELRALRVSNLRGLDGEGVVSIAVEHGWDDREGERAPKSQAGVREIPMSETLRLILAAHVERKQRSGEDLVFGRTPTEPFTPTHISKRVAKAWTAANAKRAEAKLKALTPIVLHECRHSFSSFLDAAGISETRADRYMGHSNSSVASRYRHQLDGQLTEDAATLEAYLSGAAVGKVVPLAAAG